MYQSIRQEGVGCSSLGSLPEVVAEGLLAAIEGDGFEHYLPDLKAFVDAKQADIDSYLAGVAGIFLSVPVIAGLRVVWRRLREFHVEP